MKQQIILFGLLLIFTFSSCEKATNTRAFYYWKTNLNFKASDNFWVDKLDIKVLYVRCFDVDWSAAYEDAIPLGVLATDDRESVEDAQVIPTVFIVNRVFKHLEPSRFGELADNLLMKIPFTAGVSEIQIDCDWTASTRDEYFAFLKILRTKLHEDQLLSVTIRLHQYRDRKSMGIPPADRGMLMCYNMVSPRKPEAKNAIIDATIVEQYLKGESYPLNLDIALPLFYWGAWFRGDEYQGILSNWNKKDAADKWTYNHRRGQIYTVKKDTVIGLNYLREGDRIRMDGAFETELEKTIELIKNQINPKNARITFFDWNQQIIKDNEANLEKYYHQLQ